MNIVGHLVNGAGKKMRVPSEGGNRKAEWLCAVANLFNNCTCYIGGAAEIIKQADVQKDTAEISSGMVALSDAESEVTQWNAMATSSRLVKSSPEFGTYLHAQNVNKYVYTAERKYSYVFMDTTHECNALYIYEKLCLELCR
jgi:hypothetical protein